MSEPITQLTDEQIKERLAFISKLHADLREVVEDAWRQLPDSMEDMGFSIFVKADVGHGEESFEFKCSRLVWDEDDQFQQVSPAAFLKVS